MSKVFVGIIVVAIVGNAAEHSPAVLAAIKNRMDLSFGIAMGSSTQIALFVAPLLVFLSYFMAPQPMDLVFTRGEILAVIVAETTSDTSWNRPSPRLQTSVRQPSRAPIALTSSMLSGVLIFRFVAT